MSIGFKVVGGERPRLTEHRALGEIVQQCWRPVPRERIGMQQALDLLLPSWDR